MDLMEYKSVELFCQYGVPAHRGVVVDSVDEIDAVKDLIEYPSVVKAQVQIGGRGKAGGIKFANNLEEAKAAASAILGMDIKGHTVKKIMFTKKADVDKELYISIMMDRATKSPIIIFSAKGGMDIEAVAKETPEDIIKVTVNPLIGIQPFMAKYLLSKAGLDLSLAGGLFKVITAMYTMFDKHDCMLVEINPLSVNPEGEFLAIDGKVSVDDNSIDIAVQRHPDIIEFRESISSATEEPLVKEARAYKFLYVPCDESGDTAVMSNGSGMIMTTMDRLAAKGIKTCVGFDLGGGATSDRIAEAVRIVTTNPNVKNLFINIFGGITRCDEVAGGIANIFPKLNSDVCIVIRMEGTNKDIGLKIIESLGNNVIAVDGIDSGVDTLVQRRASK